MQTKLSTSLTAVLAHFIFGVACAKPGLTQPLLNTAARDLNQAAIERKPADEINPPYSDSLQFGRVSLGGTGCEGPVSETAIIERDFISITDFATSVNLKRGSTAIKRKSCNLTLPFQTDGQTGIAILGIFADHDYMLPYGTHLEIFINAFIPGSSGPVHRESFVGHEHRKQLESRELLFEEPLIICKTDGLLRLNINQILENDDGVSSGRSTLRELKVIYTPIECH